MMDPNEVRIKEEPRMKEEEPSLLVRTTDPRYHPYLRPASHVMQPPPSILDRTRLLPTALAHHYPPPATHWSPHAAADPFYRYDMRYNPLMEVMRAEEERAKLFGAYPPHPSQLRPKDPSLMHLRPGPPGPHKMCATPPTDLLKKEEPR